MKKSKNNIIDDWLQKHGNPIIKKHVEQEIQNGVESPLVNVKSPKYKGSKKS